MRADNSHHVVDAARRRARATRRSAVAALRRMNEAGMPITFDSLAREAGVSRSWLYNQPDLRAEVERLRDRPHPAADRRVPDRSGAFGRLSPPGPLGPEERQASRPFLRTLRCLSLRPCPVVCCPAAIAYRHQRSR